MNIVRTYINYLQDNPKGYWFKRRLYGWGWTPATWQGFLVLFLYVVAVLFLVFTINKTSSNREIMRSFLLPIVVLTIALIGIGYVKGETPRWQWGLPDKDKKIPRRVH